MFGNMFAVQHLHTKKITKGLLERVKLL